MIAGVAKGRGPRSWEHARADAQALEYNGDAGGRNLKWYTQSEFNAELGNLGVSEETCSERQCVKVLQTVNVKLESRAWLRDSTAKEYAGPQCYPQLRQPQRVQANAALVAKARAQGGDNEERRRRMPRLQRDDGQEE